MKDVVSIGRIASTAGGGRPCCQTGAGPGARRGHRGPCARRADRRSAAGRHRDRRGLRRVGRHRQHRRVSADRRSARHAHRPGYVPGPQGSGDPGHGDGWCGNAGGGQARADRVRGAGDRVGGVHPRRAGARAEPAEDSAEHHQRRVGGSDRLVPGSERRGNDAAHSRRFDPTRPGRRPLRHRARDRAAAQLDDDRRRAYPVARSADPPGGARRHPVGPAAGDRSVEGAHAGHGRRLDRRQRQPGDEAGAGALPAVRRYRRRL